MYRPLTENRLLEVWEQCYGCSHFQRATRLLHFASPGLSGQQLGDLAVGERDQILISSCVNIFGQVIEAKTRCSECGVDLETQIDLTSFLSPEYKAKNSAEISIGAKVVTLEPIRIKDLSDMHLLGPSQWLATKILVVEEGQQQPTLEQQELVNESLADLDPKADLCVEMTCSECGSIWLDAFDITCHFWIKLDALCKKLLVSIHVLANAYGWTEQDIMRLSPWRREVYLDMVRSS